jgi:hypothetical protein
MNSGAEEGYTAPAPLVASIGLLLLQIRFYVMNQKKRPGQISMIRLNETSIIEQKRERLFLAIKGKN